jgi:glycine/D-amino acid oxidase-like deaminating enzyme
MRHIETIIIGAGISGISCATHLRAAGREFLVIAEDLGGRIRSARDGSMNMGAYYVMDDYHHVRKLVKPGRDLNILKVALHDGDETYTTRSLRFFAHLPQFFRMRRLLRKFRRHYEAFKKICEKVSQARALRSDPFLWKLYRQDAVSLIRQHRIETIARHFAVPGLHGSTFMPIARLSAFNFLQFSLPSIVGIREFEFDADAVIADFRDAIVRDSVTHLAREEGSYRIQTRGGEHFSASNVVVATPIHVAKDLLALEEVKKPVRAHMFALSGRLRPAWAAADLHLFSDDDRMLAISRQGEDRVLLCSRDERPDFARFFSDYEIVDHVFWNPAFNLEGDVLLECEQGENLYLIGDYNVCGLEDSYITGLYAANRITGAAPGP